jgi:hypothetical protein
MRWLINYLLECFCIHDFEITEQKFDIKDYYAGISNNTRVYMRCKKCGYHKKHWKF